MNRHEQAGNASLLTIEVARFRNLDDGVIQFEPGLNIVAGINGQGKSNLLEAIYLLGTTKSFRTTRLKTTIRSGASDSLVSGQVRDGDRRERLALRLSELEAKQLVRGNRPVAVNDYLGVLVPTVFTAESRLLVKGAPADRRAYLDRSIAACRAGYVESLAAFRRALRQKAVLLERRATRLEVEAWNAEFARRAAILIETRRDWLEELKKKQPDVGRRVFGSDQGIELEYRPSPSSLRGAIDTEGALQEALDRVLGQELRGRRTLIGPQRDDVTISLGGREAGTYASAGEQRRTAFILVLSSMELSLAARKGVVVMLMDDVDSEFDEGRLDRILDYLRGATQTIVATAKQSVVDRYRAESSVLQVAGGKVTAG